MAKEIKQSRVTATTDDIQLTLTEKLLIWRRRKHFSQTEAAQYWELSYHFYRLLEYGAEKAPENMQKMLSFIELLPHERCFIYRKRCEKTQDEVAKEMGICRYWLRLQETGMRNCNALISYWEC